MARVLLFISSCLHLISSHAILHPQPRIINGIPSRVSQFPFVAVIRLLQYDSNNATFAGDAYCGASLLRKEYPATFLSGSHCVFNNTDDLIVEVLASNTDQQPIMGVTGWPIISYIIHEQFSWISLDNDIALLFIDADLTTRNDLETVSIPNLLNSLSSPSPCCSNVDILQAIGYGHISFGGFYSETLEYTNLGYIENVRCNQLLCEYETGDIDCTYIYATDNNICGLGNYSTACHGDSGGPLIKFGTNQQVGIISGGIECISWLPAIFTNTGIYYNWIYDKLDQYQGTDIEWPIYPWTPTLSPSIHPTTTPSNYPSTDPTNYPSAAPTSHPTHAPTNYPSIDPTNRPSTDPTNYPSSAPTHYPSSIPTNSPSSYPTHYPSMQPIDAPTRYPTNYLTMPPTKTDISSTLHTTAIPPDPSSQFITIQTKTDSPSINPTKIQIPDIPSTSSTTIARSNPTVAPVVKETFWSTDMEDTFDNIPVASSLSHDTQWGLSNFELIIYGLIIALIIICVIVLILIVYIPYKKCTKTTNRPYETVKSNAQIDTNEEGEIGYMMDDTKANSPNIIFTDPVDTLEPILE